MTDETPADHGAPNQTPADDSEPTLGADEPTAEAPPPAPATAGPEPTEAVSAPAPAASAATPDAVAAPPGQPPGPPPSRRRGVFVPVWVAAVIAVLIIGGIGFAIGYALGDDGDSDSNSAASSQQAPTTTSPSNRGGGDNGNDDDGGNGNSGQGVAPVAFLGVGVDDVDDGGGARVTAVGPNSPAADAGLRADDVITRVDDATIEDATDLIGAVRDQEPGDDVEITYTRDGQSHTVEVELASRPGVPRGIPS